MKTKKVLAIILTLAMVIVFSAACSGGNSGGSAESGAPAAGGSSAEAPAPEKPAATGDKIKIICASTSPETSVGNTLFYNFKEELESRSDEFLVDIYPMGQLGGDRELIESEQEGSIQCVIASTGPYSNFVPDMAVFDLPFAFRDFDEMDKAVHDSAMLDPLQKAFEDVNLHIVTIHNGGFRVLWTQKKVESAADLKGIKLRVMENEDQMNTWKLLGAEPVVVAFTELYTALQQGLVEGQDNSFEVTYINKFQELTPFVAETNHLSGAAVISMSKIFRDGLTPEQVQLIDECFATAIANGPDMVEIQNDYIAKVQSENGVTLVPFSNEAKDECKELTSDVWANIQGKVSAEAFGGFNKAIENARK